jgi:CHAT domain-containing protein
MTLRDKYRRLLARCKSIGSIGTIIFACLYHSPVVAQDIPAWKSWYDSTQLFWGKDWPKTISLLKQAEQSALSDLGLYDASYLTIVNDLGLAYWQNKDFSNAEKFLSRSLTIKREIYSPQDPETYRSMSNLAGLFTDQGKENQAKSLYWKIVYQPPAELESDLVWKAGKNLLRLYENQNQLDSAGNLLIQLKILNAAGPDHIRREYEIRLMQGRLDRRLANYEAARLNLENLVNDLSRLLDPAYSSLYIQSLQESGLLYLSTGSFNKAEKNLLHAFRLAKAEPHEDNALLTEILNNLASVYERLNIYDKAIGYYQEALALCRQMNDVKALSCSTILSNLAGIHLHQGNFSLAIDRYEEIKKNLEATPSESTTVFYITVLNNLASAYRITKNYPKASELLNKAYKLLQENKLGQDDLAAIVMNNMAVLLTAQGKLGQAEGYYQKAYDIRRNLYGENSVLLMDLASNRAVVLWALGRNDEAIPLFQQSINLAIRQIRYVFPNLNEEEQIQFYKRLKEDFERFNTIAFQATSRPELLTDVFNHQVIIKSLLFFTQQHRNDLIQHKNDSLLIREYELLREKREQLGHLYQLPLKEQRRVKISTAALEKEIDALDKSISLKTSETVAEKLMAKEIQWKEIQQQLQPDEALIEVVRYRKYDFKNFNEAFAGRVSFGFTDSVYYAALITTREILNHPKVILMKGGNNMEKRLLNYYRNTLKFEVPDEHSYNHYWKPFGSQVSGKAKVYFAGDGVYHKINLNTMRDPSSGRFVLEECDLHYLLNPAQYLEKRKAPFTRQHAVLIGDPAFDIEIAKPSKTRNEEEKFTALPGAGIELQKLDVLLKSKKWTTELYIKKTATEKNIKGIYGPDILHIATHGFFSTDVVMLSASAKKDFLFQSGLVLAGANKNIGEETEAIDDDGILTAYEVMNLNLANTNLVVLSACETGLGKVENGEGVYGLQRSFLQAGARNVMISLWKVDDYYTQELMSKFYFFLFEGKPKREALKAAQLHVKTMTPNPYHWGGFIMVGVD